MESELSLLTVDVQLSRKGTGIVRNLSDSTSVVSGTILSYSTVLNSFSRSDSGNYSCVATIMPQPNSSTLYLNGTGTSVSNQTQVTTGVFLSLRGSYVNTNSNIFITDIGEGDCGALLCYTDLNECCQNRNTTDGDGPLGEWFYPNRSITGTRSNGKDFEFCIDRGPSVVRLNRKTNATSTTGQFCCEVPAATSTKTRICINVIAPQSKQTVTCTTGVAIGAAVAVGATIIIECLIIGAPIIAVLLCKCILCLKKRKSDHSRNDVDNYELSNTAKYTCTPTASNVIEEKEIIYMQPDHTSHNKTATDKSVIQDSCLNDEDYEVMNRYTVLQGDDNVKYAAVLQDTVGTKSK